MDGGMTLESIPETAVIAPDRAAGYPWARIWGMVTLQSMAASAADEPWIPPIITLRNTLTWASPPVMWPTRTRARSNRRWAIPPEVIREPASMKSGIASRTKLSLALAVLAATTARGTSWVQATPMTPARARQT